MHYRFVFFFSLFIYYVNGEIVSQQQSGSGDNTDDCLPLDPPSMMDNLTQEAFLSLFTASCRYDHLVRPPTERALIVHFQIDIKHIESVDNTQFKSHLLVQLSFVDERLNYSKISPNRGYIVGKETLRNRIWLPHLVVKNERSSSLMGLDEKDVFIKISPLGEVTYSYRMTSTFYCWMDLRKFPFDNQLCKITWTSWTYNYTNLELRWVKENPYILEETLHLTEFSLDEIWTDYEKSFQSSNIKTRWDDGYSSVILFFKLKREVGYYILEYFLPSILLVCMSWVSFWIAADSAPARTTLGSSTMLSFITLNGNMTKNLPKVSYVKASEIWFFGITTFIFCSLAEFTFVNVIWRRRKKVELAKQSSKYIIKGALSPRLARKEVRKSQSFTSFDSKYQSTYSSTNSLEVPRINEPFSPGSQNNNINNYTDEREPTTPTNIQQQQQQHHQFTEMTPQDIAIWIDRKARVLFPLTFLLYNIFYWSFVYAL